MVWIVSAGCTTAGAVTTGAGAMTPQRASDHRLRLRRRSADHERKHRHKEDQISLAYSIFILPFIWPFMYRRFAARRRAWDPSHKPNAGRRGAFLVPRAGLRADLGGAGQLTVFQAARGEIRD